MQQVGDPAGSYHLAECFFTELLVIVSTATSVSRPQGSSQVVPLCCGIALRADQGFPRQLVIPRTPCCEMHETSAVQAWLPKSTEYPLSESQPA